MPKAITFDLPDCYVRELRKQSDALGVNEIELAKRLFILGLAAQNFMSEGEIAKLTGKALLNFDDRAIEQFSIEERELRLNAHMESDAVKTRYQELVEKQTVATRTIKAGR